MNVENYYFGQLVNAYISANGIYDKHSQDWNIDKAIAYAKTNVDVMLKACPYVPEFIEDTSHKDDNEMLYGVKNGRMLSEDEKNKFFEFLMMNTRDSMWLERLAISNKITVDRALLLFKHFLKQLHQSHEIGKGIKEVHRHFTNWLKINKYKTF